MCPTTVPLCVFVRVSSRAACLLRSVSVSMRRCSCCCCRSCRRGRRGGGRSRGWRRCWLTHTRSWSCSEVHHSVTKSFPPLVLVKVNWSNPDAPPVSCLFLCRCSAPLRRHGSRRRVLPEPLGSRRRPRPRRPQRHAAGGPAALVAGAGRAGGRRQPRPPAAAGSGVWRTVRGRVGEKDGLRTFPPPSGVCTHLEHLGSGGGRCSARNGPETQ